MLHDNYGIADMVSLSFVGDALVWFTQLDSEVAQDWSLLERALLEKYHDSSSGVSVSPRCTFRRFFATSLNVGIRVAVS